jgi:hypothetical protein
MAVVLGENSIYGWYYTFIAVSRQSLDVSVQGVEQKPGFWCSTSHKLLAAGRFSVADGVLWQEKPGFLALW